ncbi:hypothetical protein ABTZ46_20940 [Nocardioides sp. NPDC126508]
MTTWFTSDLHFGHTRLLELSGMRAVDHGGYHPVSGETLARHLDDLERTAG